jgi:Protein of unknown function (DUF4232)
MSVVAPPEPPRPDELELLIREARARQRRRWVIVAAIAAAATGAAFAVYGIAGNVTTKSSPGERGPLAAEPVCRANALAISFVHKGAVMGEEGGLLRFTNMGRSTCTISGWPTVVAVTRAGSRVRAVRILHAPMLFATFWLHGPRVPTLALLRGGSGYSILGGYDNPVGRPAGWRCPVAHRLIVIAPGTQHGVGISGLLWTNHAYPPTYLPLCGGKPFVSPIRPRPALLR